MTYTPRRQRQRSRAEEPKDLLRMVTGKRMVRMKMPYMITLLESFALLMIPNLGTFGITKWNVLIWDAKVCNEWELMKVAFVIAHELMHVFHKHCTRAMRQGIDKMGPEAQELWNCVADGFINRILKEVFGGWCPDDAILPEHLGLPDNITTEQGFWLLWNKKQEEKEKQREQEQQQQQQQTQDGAGSGEEDEGAEPEGGESGEGEGGGEDDDHNTDGGGDADEDSDDQDEPDNSQDGGGSDGDEGEEETEDSSGSGGDSEDESDQSGDGGSETNDPGPMNEARVCRGHCGSAAGHALVGEPDGDHEASRNPTQVDKLVEEVAEKIAQLAKTAGNIPAGIVQLAKLALEKPEVPWDQKLAKACRRSFQKRKGQVDYQWDGRSRKQAAVGFGHGKPIMPSFFAPVPIVEWVEDTSGSMMGEHDTSLREAKGVLDSLGAEMSMVSIDCAVHAQGKVRSVKDMAKLMQGGGGTDFRPYFNMLEERRGQKPHIVIFRTDGYGQAPDHSPRGCHVIWLLSDGDRIPYDGNRNDVTWGEVIRVKSVQAKSDF